MRRKERMRVTLNRPKELKIYDIPCQHCGSVMEFQYIGLRHYASDYSTKKWYYRYYRCPGCKSGYLIGMDDEITNDMKIKRIT